MNDYCDPFMSCKISELDVFSAELIDDYQFFLVNMAVMPTHCSS